MDTRAQQRAPWPLSGHDRAVQRYDLGRCNRCHCITRRTTIQSTRCSFTPLCYRTGVSGRRAFWHMLAVIRRGCTSWDGARLSIDPGAGSETRLPPARRAPLMHQCGATAQPYTRPYVGSGRTRSAIAMSGRRAGDRNFNRAHDPSSPPSSPLRRVREAAATAAPRECATPGRQREAPRPTVQNECAIICRWSSRRCQHERAPATPGP